MLFGKEPDPVAVEAMDMALILHADHEFNASTFAARVIASTLSDMHSAIIVRDRRAQGPAARRRQRGGDATMLEEIGTPRTPTTWMRDALARKEKIMGFGHRVYKDGRSARHAPAHDGAACWPSAAATRAGTRCPADRGQPITPRQEPARERRLLLGVGLHQLGIPRDLFTPIFAVSRVSGWTAHVLEQYEHNRLIRPRAQYTGPVNQVWVPFEKR